MRNLSVCTHAAIHIPNANISATALDTYEENLFVASELSNLNGEVAIAIWKINQKNEDKSNEAFLLTSFTSVASTAFSPLSPQIVSFRFVAETRRLVVILLGGDISVIAPYDDEITYEVEGTFDSGILAASWCPDESLLVLVTGDSKLISMTVTFDILSEAPLHTTDFGEDEPINVGWGSKQTQFHGSLGKAAAQQPSDKKVASSPDDDTFPRISWRGDGSLFAVSALSPPDSSNARRRTVRVYDRMASLQSTSEPVPGLEHPLAWRPSGNLIAGTQRFGFEGGGAGVEGRHDVIFFERNGLQHGQFELRPKNILTNAKRRDVSKNQLGYRVREMSWSAESSILCIWIECNEDDIVQLWTTSNYHWYLKQEIVITRISVEDSNHFTSVGWHPEQPMHLILTTASTVIQRTYAWDHYTSPAMPPHDSGTVCVIDGSTLLLTPFRAQNVPPPMCSHQLSPSSSLDSSTLDRINQTVSTPIHVSLSPSADVIAVLWGCGRIALWDLRTRLGPGSDKVMDPIKLRECQFQDKNCQQFRQINVLMTEQLTQNEFRCRMVVLGSSSDGQDMLAVVELRFEDNLQIHWIGLPKRNGRLIASSGVVCWQAYDGEVYDVDVKNSRANPVARFPEFCFLSNRISLPDSESGLASYIGLGKSGKLHLITGELGHVLATHATSFVVTDGFCIFTTTSQEAVFAPLASLAPFMVNANDEEVQKVISGWEVRRIERGSRIVTTVPSTMSLVLQMPRGNLETINPRPLVMSVVKQDLDMKNYRKAFLTCRKHRIDLNTLVDHNLPDFLKSLPSFVEQIGEVDYINLFLTSIGNASRPPEVITRICDALRVELEAKNLTKYVNCILTAYIVRSPPGHESSLELLLRLRETDPHLIEDAVKYMIFLVDADTLFNAALGMYDFSLVLTVARHAQKDPREYLPFLRELRTMEKYYQRYKIDDHLKRHERALKNLSLAGEEHFEEAMEYVAKHRLHDQAISIWKGTDWYSVVLGIYGDWLLECGQFREAALVFTEANQSDKAMLAHEGALEWRQLFDLAIREGVSQDDIISIGYRIAEDLYSKKRYSEGAQVLLDYSKDVREAVITLVQGNEFSEARRIVTLHDAHELLTDIIHPASFDSRAQIEEDVDEMREQLRKQLLRLRELRVKRTQEPEFFYGTDDNENLHNVDAMTDVSMAGTTFTRYTAAPSATSKTSKRSSRSKRKMLLKAESGRKGTVHEEEYLFKSVAKLVDRFNNTQDEANSLFPHLVQFTSEHRREAKALRDSIQSFRRELQLAIDEIWQRSPQPPPIASVITTYPATSPEGPIQPSIKIEQPILNELSWAMPLLSDVDP